MIDYTLAAIEKTKEDLKRGFFVFNFLLQILYIAYLFYAIFAPAGSLIANVVLCVISLGYFAFYVFGYEKVTQKQAKTARKAYNWLKLAISAFTAGVAFYGIYATTTHVTAVSVIMVSLMVVFWVLRVVLEVFICFFESKANIILEGIRADIENAVKPVKTVGNTIKKIIGEEVKPEPEHNKYRKVLDEIVDERRKKKREEKKNRKKHFFNFKRKGNENNEKEETNV